VFDKAYREDPFYEYLYCSKCICYRRVRKLRTARKNEVC